MILESIASEYKRYKFMAETAIRQTEQRCLNLPIGEEHNSIVTLVWHISGNLKSRFTDFLQADGEKPWRQRDTEFADRTVDRDELMRKWDEGWAILLDTLSTLVDEDLTKEIHIRNQPLSVMEALHRSLAHTAFHIGEIVYIAKVHAGNRWQTLSIPLGQSETYNLQPTREKLPESPR